jgi:hypothetical protein
MAQVSWETSALVATRRCEHYRTFCKHEIAMVSEQENCRGIIFVRCRMLSVNEKLRNKVGEIN